MEDLQVATYPGTNLNHARRRALVADDEPGVRRLLREILGKDYSVLEAENGREAVEIALREKPDVILLDVMMPDMDGITACAAIKRDATTNAIPVVIISAITYELNKKMAEKGAGASAYITKPFHHKDILAVLATLLSAETVSRERNERDTAGL